MKVKRKVITEWVRVTSSSVLPWGCRRYCNICIDASVLCCSCNIAWQGAVTQHSNWLLPLYVNVTYSPAWPVSTERCLSVDPLQGFCHASKTSVHSHRAVGSTQNVLNPGLRLVVVAFSVHLLKFRASRRVFRCFESCAGVSHCLVLARWQTACRYMCN